MNYTVYNIAKIVFKQAKFQCKQERKVHVCRLFRLKMVLHSYFGGKTIFN